MIQQDIERYIPFNEQEECDKALILSFIKGHSDAFFRTCLNAHMTASSWIVNHQRTQVLMVYHNIYQSWSWTGGHADGDENLLRVALREAREETGVEHIHPVLDDIYSLEALTVDGHLKNGRYVSSHIHLNVTYLLEADESDSLRVCEGENSGVRWFTPQEAMRVSSEPWFVENIYKKLDRKLSLIRQ